MPRKSPERHEVVAAVRRVLRRGLPVTPRAVDLVLLGLRGVLARAVDPADEASCTAALDGVLRGVLARFPDARYAVAARALFGLPPAEPARTSPGAVTSRQSRPGTKCTTSASGSSPG